jgi:hypothetical protein
MDIFDRLYSQKILTDAYKALLNEVAAAPAAPAKPATKPPAAPAKPAPAPNRNPFKIPKPAVAPRPQNLQDEQDSGTYVAEGFLREAFEDEPTPSNRGFWSDNERGFRDWRGENMIGKHPIIRRHGEQLARGAYDLTSGGVTQHGLRNPADHRQPNKFTLQEVDRAFHQILQIEQRHREQLEQLAKDITVQVWGEEVRPLLEGSLERPNEETAPDDQDPGQDQEEQTAEAGEHLVQKRVLANMLTQGSAMHLMFQAQHLITARLNSIDPRLNALYAKFAFGSAHNYWLTDLERVAHRLSGMVVGRAKVESEEDQDDPESANFTIKAQAVMFPILVQELCKGVANYLSMAGIAGVPAAELQDLFSKVDNPADEHYYIQVGHELWRRFLKAKPQGVSAAKATVAIHKLDAEGQNRVIEACIANPEEAKRILAELLAEPEATADDVLDDLESSNEDWRSSLDDEGEDEASEDDDWGRSDYDSEGGLAEPGEEDDKDDDWWR